MATKKKKTTSAKRGRGQPTKYKPEYCDMLKDAGRKGEFIEKFILDWDISKETLYKWAKEHPDFSDAYKQYKRGMEHWHKRLFQNLAIGKLPKGNVTAAIWLSKIVCGYTEDNLGNQQDPIDATTTYEDLEFG